MSTWALIGSPNSGKTTLYNWLTGAKAKTVNYPGATVEYSLGSLRNVLVERSQGYNADIIDTPGIYSLNPQSDDEVVTYKTLFDPKKIGKNIDAVIVVADVTQLSRHLVLVEQLKETGFPFLLVVTMIDMLEKQKAKLDIDLIKKNYGIEVIKFDGLLGKGLDNLVDKMSQMKPQPNTNVVREPARWTIAQQEAILKRTQEMADMVVVFPTSDHHIPELERTIQIDRYLLHPLFGFIFFFLIMTFLFSSIYWMAQPAMNLIDQSFAYLSEKITTAIPGLLGNFLGSGLLAAIGGVLVFIPQIFILFLGIGLLEASGYLARVAALIDRPLAMVGLGGRSFVPLLSGFACAIPAIMATRNITSKKEKLIAQMVIPFMACSARLPVYGLLIGFLFADKQPIMAGFVMSLLYFISILVGALSAKVLAMILKGQKQNRLLMELPAYRRPRFNIILMQALTKSKSFAMRAGPIILILALVLWFGTTFPRPSDGVTMTASEVAANSYAAQFGKVIEPVFKPLGVDWRVGFGLISAFAAREVFVSALAIVFNVEGSDEAQTQGLITAMREATFPDGAKIFTIASVVGIFIFFIIALQCISTVGILKRESGSWTPALMQLGVSNVMAYVLAAIAVAALKAVGL